MQPGEGPFQSMMEIDRLAADLHRLGDRLETELRKCVVIVAGLSADYEVEVRMLENNPASLDRTEIERVVGNQYSTFVRQQYDSKALSSLRSTTTVDRGEKERRPRNRFESNCFNCGRKGHRAKIAGTRRRRSKNQYMPPPTRRAEVGESATSVGLRSTLRINIVACAEVPGSRL